MSLPRTLANPSETDFAPTTAGVFHLNRIGFVLLQAALTVVAWTIVRVILLTCFGPVSVGGRTLVEAFLIGAHFDVVAALVIWAPFAVWSAAAPEKWLQKRWFRWVTLGASTFWWGLIVFLCFAEYYFFKEYLSRFNTVAIDYIHYWTEVTGNIQEMYPVRDIIGACVIGSGALVFLAWSLEPLRTGTRSSLRFSQGLGWIVIATGAAATVSTQELRFTSERALSEIADNGLIAGLAALWTRDLDYSAFYPTTDRDSAFAEVRSSLSAPGSQLSSDPLSLERSVSGDRSRPRLNVVIMLEESLGSEFWGVLNGKDESKSYTPCMDRLAKSEGLLFDNIYADGNRTIRGVEGVLASFPPLPGDSILARTKTQNMETLAQVLRRDGYSSEFIYPGHGVFDGLRTFALDNGFDRFVEEKDFTNPVFSTAWGVSNEDLYQKAIDEMRQLHASGKPFFITTLSVSNHQPFTYPDGRIKQPSSMHSRKNAVKYVDFALSKFFEAVKREAFWQDTIFVVVADHGARVYGSQTIPMHSYEIPLLFMGPAAVKEPSRIGTLGCQLDIAPTILGMIGRPYETTFYGSNLLQVTSGEGRAVLHHNRSVGIFSDQHLVTFSLNKQIDIFHGDPKNDKLQPVTDPDETDRKLIQQGTALFQTADELYNSRRYHVQAPASDTDQLAGR